MLLWTSTLDIANEALTVSLQDRSKSRIGLAIISIILNAKRAAGIKSEIVGLARVTNSVIVCQQTPCTSERIDVRRLWIADDFAKRMILFDYDHNMGERRCSIGRRDAGRDLRE